MPEIDLGPLSDLTPLGVLSLTALITFIDVVAAYILSATQGKFDLSYVSAWLISHSSKRVVPIYVLLAFGVGVGIADIPAIPALYAMAVAGVVAYLGETIKSILVNFADARAVGDESSVPKLGPTKLTADIPVAMIAIVLGLTLAVAFSTMAASAPEAGGKVFQMAGGKVFKTTI